MLKLFDFQRNAIDSLKDFLLSSGEKITLKSPTGSGKTIILSSFISECFESFPNNYSFIWFCPGQGNLEEQSKDKFDTYFPNNSSKLLQDLITSGLNFNEIAFINWEKLNKKGNNAIKKGERKNFFDQIDEAHSRNQKIVIVIDESHKNFTGKTQEIIDKVKPFKTIYASATPLKSNEKDTISISDEEVIEAGLIKKYMFLNDKVYKNLNADNITELFLKLALEKQKEIRKGLSKIGSNVNPLILIQLPNAKEGEILIKQVEDYLKIYNITTENGYLAIWLDKIKANLENITDNNSKVEAIIFKQGIATGWDCPRAYILIKLRYNTDETFTIQTIGRVRRMAEQKHYDSILLDSCYIYTADNQFIKGFNDTFTSKTGIQKVVYLKDQYKNVAPKIPQEYKESLNDMPNLSQFVKFTFKHFERKYGISNDLDKNLNLLKNNGYYIEDKLQTNLNYGTLRNLTDEELSRLGTVTILSQKDKSELISISNLSIENIRKQINIDVESLKKILKRFFFASTLTQSSILRFDNEKSYRYFLFNNSSLLAKDFKEAIVDNLGSGLNITDTLKKEFYFPLSDLVYVKDLTNYDKTDKNVYGEYPRHVERASEIEQNFESFLISNKNVKWYAKNGDKGDQYFSIIYTDNLEVEHRFYPDFIFNYNDEVWIIETKGSLNDLAGENKDGDKSSGLKFVALKNYFKKYSIKGGFVRYSPIKGTMMFNNTVYSNDSDDGHRTYLSDVLV